MLNYLFLIPAFPLAGFVVLALLGRQLRQSVVAAIGTGSVGLSALLSILISVFFALSPPTAHVFTQSLGPWFIAGDFSSSFSLSLDPLSLLMMLVITVVGFLIHLYSTEFMQEDEAYSRFFAYLNLFVAAMLVLVLADNLVLLYLGWEGVGLCSFLLIGFWHRDPANARAARKAFIVTRIGDTAMIIGLFLLFTHLNTLNIADLMRSARETWPSGSPLAIAAAALLLCGAVGKSAQLPLQVWLPDAMAGPSPVSALIHAATMVTAGVYLIARTHVLFELAPPVRAAVAVIGAATLLLAGLSALAQRDIKRSLAYSTISQIGYMFLALGAGAWSAALFHFMTHAFFKALLFLAAGAVILAQHHEHDMFRMGGLRHRLPALFWTFLAGAASLSALPLVSAGFYSKDMILWQVWSSPSGGALLTAAGLIGAFITATYTFRMVFLTFFGEARMDVSYRPGVRMLIPLIVLAALSLAGGFVELPHSLGSLSLLSDLLTPVFPALHSARESASGAIVLQVMGAAACLGGITLAFVLYRSDPALRERIAARPAARMLSGIWLSGWGFDKLYDALLIRPFMRIARILGRDALDDLFSAVATMNKRAHAMLSRTQTGGIRWYTAGIVLGAIIIVGVLVLS